MIIYRGSLFDRANELDNLIGEFCKMAWTENPTQNEAFAIDQLKAETGKILKVAMATFTNLGGLGIRPYKRTLLVTPGNGYLATIEAMCYQLLFWPEHLMVILSSRDFLGKAFADFMASQPDLLTEIHVVDPTIGHGEKRIMGYRFYPDTAVIYGSNSTITDWKTDLFNYTKAKVVTYGNKASIGYHPHPITLERSVDEYAEDFFLYDGIGCLNTSALYIKVDLKNRDRYEKQITMVEDFAKEIGNRRHMFMAPYQGVKTLNSIQAQLMASGKDFKQVNGVFIREPIQAPVLSGGHGTAMVVLVSGIEDILWEWEGCGHDLSSATLPGINTTMDIMHPDVNALFELGCSRITRPGRAQHPTHRWRHDGRPILPNELWQECTCDW